MNVTALREIKLLRELHSPYIVRLLDVFPHKRNLLLVRAGSDSRSLGSALRGTPLQPANPGSRAAAAHSDCVTLQTRA